MAKSDWKTSFLAPIWIDVVSSHMDSPNVWHFIWHPGTVLDRHHMYPDQQGLVAHEIPNHWISLNLNDILVTKIINILRFKFFFIVWKFQNVLMIGNSESVKEIWTDLTRSDKNYFKTTNGRFINSGIHHSNDMEPFSKIRLNRLNSEKFQNYSFWPKFAIFRKNRKDDN